MPTENRDRVAILVDSSADLSPRNRRGAPIYVVPLRLSCEGKEYEDGETIDNEGVYRLQEKGELPKTSLPDPVRVAETLERIKKDGYERVIALPLSSGLSGTHNLIDMICSRRRDLETAVVETRSGSLGIGMVALQLWQELRVGLDWETLVNERVPFLVGHTYPYFSADTLEYLQKGGRVGQVTAAVGTLLNIKPIISFTDQGELVSVAKARGKRRVCEYFLQLLRERVEPGRPFNLAVANGGDPKGMAELRQALQAAFPGAVRLWEGKMDATLAAYVGRGMLGAALQIIE